MDRNLRIRMLMEGADRITRPMKDAALGSTRLSSALKDTRQKLRDLQRAQEDVAAFRRLKGGLAESGQAMQAARARATELGRALAQEEKPTRKMTREFAQAKREVETLGEAFARQKTELGELRSRLSTAGISTRDLVSGERRLRAEAAGTNETLHDQQRRLAEVTDRSRRFSAAREKFSRVQGTATGLAAGGAAAIGTGMTVLSPLGEAVSGAADYESAMTDINQKVDQSREAGRQMGEELRRAALSVNQMPEDLQRGVDALTGFGLGAQEAGQMMTPIGRAATAYKAEIEDLSRASFAARDNLKVPIDQTGKALDVMAEAGKRGAFEMKDMAQYFPELTASMQSLGSTGINAVGDLAAALQITRKGAGDSASAANNLQNLLSKINSADTIKNFRKFGIDIPAAMKKAAADGRSPIEEIVRLTQKATGGDQAKLSSLFGDMQVQQALRPLMSNLKKYQEIRSGALTAKDTVNKDFAERMRDSAEKIKHLKIEAGNLKLTLGNALLPTVANLSDRLGSWAAGLAELSRRHPNVTRALAVAAGVLGGLFLILGGGAIVLAAIVAPFAVLGSAATLLGIGLLPLIGIAAGIVAGIAALAAVAYLLYANWNAIGAWFSGLWEEIKGYFRGGIAGIGAMLLNFSPMGLMYAGVAALLNWLGVDVPNRLTGIGGYLIEGLVKGIRSKLSWLKDTIVGVASSVAGWFGYRMKIHSPSRVFAQFGDYMMQGLGVGIDAGVGHPVARIRAAAGAVSRAMAAGVAAPVLAVTPAAASGAAGGGGAAAAPLGNVTIVIKQQPGQSAQELASLVERKIRDLQRRDAATARSAFADEEDYGGLA